MAILKKGSRGRSIAELQQRLNTFLYPKGWKLTPDGVFGEQTEKALKVAQADLGLVVDGRYGPQTSKALAQALRPAAKTAKVEPDKSAMATVPVSVVTESPLLRPAPPPNSHSLVLLDTARPISEIIVHCTATPEGKRYTVADVRAWHKKRGFTDVGYHYLIDLDGTILLGRPVGQVGAHVANHNTGTIGVSYFGGVAADGKVAKDTRTPAQRASLEWLVDQLAHKHNVKRITGHNQYANKACPSFDVQTDPLSKLAA